LVILSHSFLKYLVLSKDVSVHLEDLEGQTNKILVPVINEPWNTIINNYITTMVKRLVSPSFPSLRGNHYYSTVVLVVLIVVVCLNLSNHYEQPRNATIVWHNSSSGGSGSGSNDDNVYYNPKPQQPLPYLLHSSASGADGLPWQLEHASRLIADYRLQLDESFMEDRISTTEYKKQELLIRKIVNNNDGVGDNDYDYDGEGKKETKDAKWTEEQKESEASGTTLAVTTTSATNTATDTSTLKGAKIPRNLRLAFIGDSLSRHQFLSLIYYLQSNGHWDPPPPYIEGMFPTRLQHRSYISQHLNNSMACNCHRPEGNYQAARKLHLMYGNMYYLDNNNNNNNALTLIEKMGKAEAHGHWDPRTVFDEQLHTQRATIDNYVNDDNATGKIPPYTWAGNWSYIIRHHLANYDVQYKPKYVIINAGLWEHDFTDNRTTSLLDIRRALDDNNMVGIYKTTTKMITETSSELELHDQWGCEILHHCLNLSWTGPNITDPSDYFPDGKHFKSHIYARMNQQLLQMLTLL